MSIKICATIIAIAIIVNCVPYRKPPRHTEELFAMPIPEQEEQIKKYSLEEQYELYLYFNIVVHPPAIYLADPIIESGHFIVPFLKARLEVNKNDVEISRIIYLFYRMSLLRRYDYEKDEELVALIKKKADNMNKSPLKEYVLKQVQEITEKAKDISPINKAD